MHLFSHLARKSAQKKPPHKPIGLCRGENKKKIYYMRCLTFGKWLQLVVIESRGTLLHVDFDALNYRPNSACMLF